jgi:hypothetical protein
MEFKFDINPDKNGVTITGINRNIDKIYDLIIPTHISILPVTHIGAWAFKTAKNLITVKLPETITHIGNGAFSDCSNLKTINLPNKVIYIGNFAFFQNTKLEINSLPEKLIHLGDSVFVECEYIKLTKLPKSLEHIGESAFWSTKIERLDISESVKHIGESAFSVSELTQINVSPKNKYYSSNSDVLYDKKQQILIQYPLSNHRKIFDVPGGVKEISTRAFSGSQNLEAINLPKTLKRIGKRAFSGLQRVNKLDIPNSVNFIDKYAFSGTEKLKSIKLSQKITEISDDLFRQSGISNLVIPEGVLNLGADVFYESSLEEITLPNSLLKISELAFSRAEKLKKIYIPDNVQIIEESAFTDVNDLEMIEVSKKNKFFSSLDGVLFNKRKTKLLKYPNNKPLEKYQIPSTVITIEINAFQELKHLKELIIPKNVSKVEGPMIARIGFTADELNIYVQHKEKPAGWSDDWNCDNSPVIWGHK